jgi:hypothetical protein
MPETSSFKKLKKNVTEQYLGKSVPKKYQKDYGTIYDKSEVKSVAIRIAKSKGIKI